MNNWFLDHEPWKSICSSNNLVESMNDCRIRIMAIIYFSKDPKCFHIPIYELSIYELTYSLCIWIKLLGDNCEKFKILWNFFYSSYYPCLATCYHKHSFLLSHILLVIFGELSIIHSLAKSYTCICMSYPFMS